jgi:hypothetical protein
METNIQESDAVAAIRRYFENPFSKLPVIVSPMSIEVYSLRLKYIALDIDHSMAVPTFQKEL